MDGSMRTDRMAVWMTPGEERCFGVVLLFLPHQV